MENFLKKNISEAWYINLENRKDRKYHMDEELEKYGLLNFVNRYEAVKSDSNDPRESIRASGTSHRNLIEYARDKNLDNILILEDDICFNENSFNFLKISLTNLQKRNDWDIYYITANIFDNPLKMIDDNLLKIDGCYCVHAYIVSNRAYTKILKYNPNNYEAIDLWLNFQPLIKLGGYPLIVSQIDGFSDNIGGYIRYDKIFYDVYSRSYVDLR
jgi:GR25 family glycosyltransferase involved in LPS biosynthesis